MAHSVKTTLYFICKILPEISITNLFITGMQDRLLKTPLQHRYYILYVTFQ